MNLYQCQLGIKENVIKNADFDLQNYSHFISEAIKLLKNQSIEIELKPLESKKTNGFKYEIIDKNNRKSENGIKELFSELTKVVFPNNSFNKNEEIKIVEGNTEENCIILNTKLELINTLENIKTLKISSSKNIQNKKLENVADKKFLTAKIYLKPNTYQLEKQRNALENLRNKPFDHHKPLLNLFGYPNDKCWNQSLNVDEEIDWKILSDENRDGTIEQQDFVKKALQTKDFALLEGPPGSGKTTTIIELIIQFVLQGKRVLLCSATHVAIDNVLERILENYKSKTEGIIMPIRISSNENVVQENIRPYILKNYVNQNKEKVKKQLIKSDYKSAKYLLNNIENDEKSIEKLFLNAANLVAGTTIGILKHPDIKDNNLDNLFDVLIIDEASKVTFQEFLVPAIYAKRWILVGDTKQLSPYVEDDYVSNCIASKLKIDCDKAEEIAGKLSQEYSFRHTTGFENISNDLENLIPNDKKSKSEIDKIKRMAFPSILELLQNGIGKTKDQRSNRVIYDGFDEYYKKSRFSSITFQHRMHDDIAKTSRENFYDNKNLFTSETTKNNTSWKYEKTQRVCWINSGFETNNKKIINLKEVASIKNEIENFIAWNQENKETETYHIAVLTFYVDQCTELRKMLQKLSNQKTDRSLFAIGNLKIELGTVDKFQGKEADMVLLGFTKFSTNAFYSSPNRLNVALTRAKHKLVLFGDKKIFEQKAKLNALKDLSKFQTKLTTK